MGLDKYDQSSPIFKAIATAIRGGSAVSPGIRAVADHILPDAPAGDTAGSKLAWGMSATLGAPRRMLWGPVGDAMNEVGLSDQRGVQAFDSAMEQSRQGPLTGGMWRGTPMLNIIPTLDDAFSPEIGNVAMEGITDPVSLFGGPGKAIGKGMIEAARGTGAGANWGRAIWTADDMVSNALGMMAQKVVQGGQAGLKPINGAIGRYMPSLPAWTEMAKRSTRASEFAQMMAHRGMDFTDFEIAFQNAPSAIGWNMPQTMMRDMTKSGTSEVEALFNAAMKHKATDWDSALLAYNKEVRNDLGLGAPGKAEQFYGEFQNWWKRQALTSVAYPITNAIGGMIGYTAEGGNPLKVGQDILKNARNLWDGNAFHVDDAVQLSADTGMPIPAGIAQAAGSATATQLGKKADNIAIGRDAVLMGALGALQQNMVADDQGNPLYGFLVGALGGAGVSKMSHRVQNISKGIETIIRERGWHQGMSRELVESMAEMEGVVRYAATQKTAPPAGRNTGGRVPASSLADWMAYTIQQSGGRISADEVTTHLLNRLPKGAKGGGGIQDTVLDAATNEMDDILYRASMRGKETSEAFNFNYEDLSNIERLMTNISPFATWSMKALPYYSVKIAQHPWAAGLIKDWNVASEEYRSEHGLTTRVSGALPWHGVSPLTEAILGRHTTTMINPLASLIPAGNLSGGLERMEYAESGAGKFLAGADALGFGLSPLMGMAARVAGIGDKDDPAQGIPLRAAGALAGLTGVDVAAPGRAAETAVREGITGQQVTDIGQITAERRIDELALRETGKTIGSPGTEQYLRAKLGKSGPIWERAQGEVANERGLQAVTGFVNQQFRPTAIVTDEEMAIRGAGADRVLDRSTSDGIRKLDDMSVAPTPILEGVRAGLQKIASETGQPIPPNALAILENPTGANLKQLSQDIFEYEKAKAPLIEAYKGSGPPEKRELTHALSVFYNAALLPQDMERAGLAGGAGGAAKGIKAARGAARDELLQKYPILSAYLTWKSANPEGNQDAFLAQYRPTR